MVAAGETKVLPVEPTPPTPWFILTAAALETLHVSVEEPPGVILPGVALKRLITGRPGEGVSETMT